MIESDHDWNTNLSCIYQQYSRPVKKWIDLQQNRRQNWDLLCCDAGDRERSVLYPLGPRLWYPPRGAALNAEGRVREKSAVSSHESRATFYDDAAAAYYLQPLPPMHGRCECILTSGHENFDRVVRLQRPQDVRYDGMDRRAVIEKKFTGCWEFIILEFFRNSFRIFFRRFFSGSWRRFQGAFLISSVVLGLPSFASFACSGWFSLILRPYILLFGHFISFVSSSLTSFSFRLSAVLFSRLTFVWPWFSSSSFSTSPFWLFHSSLEILSCWLHDS